MIENENDALAKANEIQGEEIFEAAVRAEEISSVLNLAVWYLPRKKPMLGGVNYFIASDSTMFTLPVVKMTDEANTDMITAAYTKAKTE